MKQTSKKSTNSRKTITRLVAVILAVLMALGLVASVLPLVFAESSYEIQRQLDALEEEAEDIAGEKQSLQEEIDATEAEKDDVVSQKSAIDRKMNLTMEEIQNVEATIEQYQLLIELKRNELKAAEQKEQNLIDSYKQRVREMEEGGTAGYLDILFNAASFSEMLDRLDWIEEIRAADDQMLNSLMDASQTVRDAEDALYEAQQQVEEEKALLEEKEQELLEESQAAQEIIDALNGESEEMQQLLLESELLEEETLDRIAVLQEAYEEAVTAENEAARIKAAEEAAQKKLEQQAKEKEEAAKKAEEEAENAANTETEETEETSETTETGTETATESQTVEEKVSTSVSFIWPASGAITSPFGTRIHPVYGYELHHDGIDIDAWRGDPVVAAAAGTVITSSYGSAAGYYCTISHADGFATIYMHFQSAPCVSVGQYVSQGQVIGYVGDTGVCTGAHLHFGMLLNGTYVNPVLYLP